MVIFFCFLYYFASSIIRVRNWIHLTRVEILFEIRDCTYLVEILVLAPGSWPGSAPNRFSTQSTQPATPTVGRLKSVHQLVQIGLKSQPSFKHSNHQDYCPTQITQNRLRKKNIRTIAEYFFTPHKLYMSE